VTASLLCDFSWLHLGIAGLASDIAGAVPLAWSFSTKTPEQIRTEVPKSVPTSLGSSSFPQGLAYSLIRQRAEARLGLVLMVLGFAMQAVVYFTGSGDALTETNEVLLAGGLVLVVWIAAGIATRCYVPWDERRTRSKMDSAGSD
jgi:peptidoglycan/LPS O-acetylase OafA/YrhL